jgi:hypothetical protein
VKKRRKSKQKMDPVQQVFNEFLGEAKQTLANSLRDILMPKAPPMFQGEEPLNLPPPPKSKIPPGTIIIKDAEVISVRDT